MGDNANIQKAWHNTEVGKGYASSGVVRQGAVDYDLGRVVDMRGPPREATDDGPALKKFKSEKQDKKDKKKLKRQRKKEERKKAKKDKKDKDKDRKKEGHFYPFLQLLASRISNTTREFTLSNGY